jgi:uncharacterized protein
MDMDYMYMFLLALVLGSAVFIGYMYREAFEDRIVNHELFFPEFPAGLGALTIFFISDIHRRSVSTDIIARAQGRADIVIIGGDLAEKGVKLERVKENLVQLASIAPVYFVWGNNDYELDRRKVKELMKEVGVKILDNSWVILDDSQGERLTLTGVDDFAVGNADLDEALAGAGSSFRILVSHNPEVASLLKEEHYISLVLSGHTHGGQIRLLGYSPYKKGGIHKLANTTLFVSNGYGTTALPLRLGAEAQTHLITLRQRE